MTDTSRGEPRPVSSAPPQEGELPPAGRQGRGRITGIAAGLILAASLAVFNVLPGGRTTSTNSILDYTTRAANATARPVNSARAVHSYLARHGLDDRISLVVARTDHDPALLKPSSHLITQAVDALDAEPGECTLVGDSVTDVQAVRLASVQSIGYANKPGKRERFTAAGAGAIINSLADLALAPRTRSQSRVELRRVLLGGAGLKYVYFWSSTYGSQSRWGEVELYILDRAYTGSRFWYST